MIAKGTKSNYLIQTVCHALDLLDQFNGEKGELGVTELSRRMALHKNNIFRLLATLESRNFIEQNSTTGGYRLGLKNLEMGQTFKRHLGLQIQARPMLESLTALTGETSCLTIMKDTAIVTLDAVETPLPVRVVTRLGVWLPSHCTAPGKLFLSAMSPGERTRHLPKALERFTPNTITDFNLLLEQLKLITVRGYSLDDEEMELGVRCVSAPVYNISRELIGAIVVSGPAARLSLGRLQDEVVPALLECAQELSRRAGGRSPGPVETGVNKTWSGRVR